MYNEDGVQIGILPSLDGYLYKYISHETSPDEDSSSPPSSIRYIDRLERFPFDLRQVLANSFKINDDIGFIGSVNVLTLGIHATTGQVGILFCHFTCL